MGDASAPNMFRLGYGCQKGWVPVSGASLERAIELNGVAVDFNKKSFLWGRHAALDPDRVQRIATPAAVIPIEQHLSRNLDELVDRRGQTLCREHNCFCPRRRLRPACLHIKEWGRPLQAAVR